jgi:hypothetical protein
MAFELPGRCPGWRPVRPRSPRLSAASLHSFTTNANSVSLGGESMKIAIAKIWGCVHIRLLVGLYVSILMVAPARADRIYDWSEKKEYWGEIIEMKNSYIDFRVGCSGAARKFDWEKNLNLIVTFAAGCQPIALDDWGGELPDRKKVKGSLFQIGNGGREDYVDTVEYHQGALTIFVRENRYPERSPRKDQLRITHVCR